MSKTRQPDAPRSRAAAATQRRAFLVSAALAALLAAAPRAMAAATAARAPAGGPLWRDRDSAALVGRRYLALAPEEGDTAHLLRCVFGADGERCAASPDALRGEIARRRARDFAAGDTVLLDGWILARTEARICALAALG